MGISNLIGYVKEMLAPESAADEQEHGHAIRVATAGVLLDLAYADSSFTIAEESRLVDFLRSHFDLTGQEAQELIEAAEELRTHTIDHWEFTNVVRRNTSFQERLEIVKTMWRMIYSDGSLHQYEGYLVRKLSELLGIEHSVMIDAKLAVLEELRSPG